MHLVYIHQYFATPNGSTGTRSYEFARRWVAAGHRVTMITSTAQLTPADVPDGNLQRRSRFTIEGIDVIALPVAYSQKMGKVARLWSFIRFLLASTFALLSLRKIDVVFATSTPLTVAVPALVRKWIFRTPFVFEVRDSWPDVPFELGYIRSRWAMRVLRWLERLTYRSAASVVALSPGMRDSVRRVGGGKVEVVVCPNSCDTDRFAPEIDGTKLRADRGWQDRFICSHIGAIGMSNGLDQLIQVAEWLRNDPEFLFVVVGDGRERPLLMRLAEQKELTNIIFTGPISKQELPAMFAASDICMAVFAPYPILEHNSANKFFDSLAAGRPVVINYSGWQREVLEDNGAGLGCQQGHLEAFAENLCYLKAHPALRASMGKAARYLAETRFNRDAIATAVFDQIAKAQKNRPIT